MDKFLLRFRREAHLEIVGCEKERAPIKNTALEGMKYGRDVCVRAPLMPHTKEI
jgi:hypothetical protein